MAKLQNRHLTLIVVGIAFVLFNILALVIPPALSLLGAAFWAAYAFSCVAFIAIAVAIYFIKLSKTAIFSTIFPLYLVIGVYFAAAMITNIVVMAAFAYNPSVVATIIINVVLLLLAVAAFVLIYMGVRHIKDDEAKTQAKVKNIRSLAVAVGSLEYRVADANVKKAIRELKDAISFSDPMGNESTVEVEEAFEGQIEILKSLIASSVPAEDLLTAIADARGLLQTRNETIRISK